MVFKLSPATPKYRMISSELRPDGIFCLLNDYYSSVLKILCDVDKKDN